MAVAQMHNGDTISMQHDRKKASIHLPCTVPCTFRRSHSNLGRSLPPFEMDYMQPYWASAQRPRWFRMYKVVCPLRICTMELWNLILMSEWNREAKRMEHHFTPFVGGFQPSRPRGVHSWNFPHTDSGPLPFHSLETERFYSPKIISLHKITTRNHRKTCYEDLPGKSNLLVQFPNILTISEGRKQCINPRFPEIFQTKLAQWPASMNTKTKSALRIDTFMYLCALHSHSFTMHMNRAQGFRQSQEIVTLKFPFFFSPGNILLGWEMIGFVVLLGLFFCCFLSNLDFFPVKSGHFRNQKVPQIIILAPRPHKFNINL